MYNSYRRSYPSKFQRSPLSSVVFIFLAIIIVIFGLIFTKTRASAEPYEPYGTYFNSFSVGDITGQDGWNHSASNQDCTITADGFPASGGGSTNALLMDRTGATTSVMCYRNGTTHASGQFAFRFSAFRPHFTLRLRNSASSYDQVMVSIGYDNGSQRVLWHFGTTTAEFEAFDGIPSDEWNRLQIDWDCNLRTGYLDLNGVTADGGSSLPLNALCDNGGINQIWLDFTDTANEGSTIVIDDLNVFDSYTESPYDQSINQAIRSTRCGYNDLANYFSISDQVCYTDYDICLIEYWVDRVNINYTIGGVLSIYEDGNYPIDDDPYATTSISNEYNPQIEITTTGRTGTEYWNSMVTYTIGECGRERWDTDVFKVTYIPRYELDIDFCDDPCSDIATSSDWFSYNFAGAFECGTKNAVCWAFDPSTTTTDKYSLIMAETFDEFPLNVAREIWELVIFLYDSTSTPAQIPLLWFDSEQNVTSTGAMLLSADGFEGTGFEELHRIIYNILETIIYGLMLLYFIKRIFPALRDNLSSGISNTPLDKKRKLTKKEIKKLYS